MKKERVKTPVDGGFGARLTVAIVFTLGAIVCLVLTILFGCFFGAKEDALLLTYLTLGFAAYSLIGLVGAIAGIKHKWADVLLIIFTAPMCLGLIGLLSVIGGAVAIKDINDPQRIEARNAKRIKSGGFGLRLAFAIILAVIALPCLILGTGVSGGGVVRQIMLVFAIYLIAATVLQFVAAFVGKNKKWANTVSIVVGALCIWTSFLGVLAIVGGVRGKRKLEVDQRAAMRNEELATRNVVNETEQLVKEEKMQENGTSLLDEFPLDYENKPGVSRVLDPNNRDNFLVENSNGVEVELEQLYITKYQGMPYFVARAVGIDQDDGSGVIVFRIDYAADRYNVETDDEVVSAVYGEYCDALTASQESVTEVTQPQEFIKPKMGAKGKKAIMIITLISYSLLLLIGILLASVPAMGNILSSIGICEVTAARAYGITIGVMWIALSPAVGLYFAMMSPLKLSLKVKVIISIISAALLVAMNAVFFIIINSVKLDLVVDGVVMQSGLAVKDFFEGSDVWFVPVSMVFASLGLILCHVLVLFRINPAKIKSSKPEKCGDSILEVIKYVLGLLVYALISIARLVLVCKEKQPDISLLISIILLTWLAFFVSFIFSILCIAIMVTVVIMYFVGFMSWAYTPSSGQRQISINCGMYEKTLTEQPYSLDGKSVWKDEYGKEYVSSDGGKTVSEYHR